MSELVPLHADQPLHELGVSAQSGQIPLMDLGQFGIHVTNTGKNCIRCGASHTAVEFATEAIGLDAICINCYHLGFKWEVIYTAQTVFPGQPHDRGYGYPIFNCAVLIDGVLYRTRANAPDSHDLLDFMSGRLLVGYALHVRHHTLANVYAARMFNNGAGFNFK